MIFKICKVNFIFANFCALLATTSDYAERSFVNCGGRVSGIIFYSLLIVIAFNFYAVPLSSTETKCTRPFLFFVLCPLSALFTENTT